MNVLCWHRPGRMVRQTVTCRHCGVAIEMCPCVGPYLRSVDSDCRACHGGGWVSLVRGAVAKFREYVEASA